MENGSSNITELNKKYTLKVSVIMPAYNLENIIQKSVEKVANMLNALNMNYEIIIVDDGSSDNTYRKALEITSENVKVLRNKINMGKGYSVKKGIKASHGEYVLMLDADMEIEIKNIKNIIDLLSFNDIVIASKRHPMAEYKAPLIRKILSVGYNNLVKLLTGVNISDTQTGLKAFKGEKIRYIIEYVTVKRYVFDVEILAIAKLLNLKVVEIPAYIIQGKLFSLRGTFRMFLDTLGIAYRLRIVKWYQKNLGLIK